MNFGQGRSPMKERAWYDDFIRMAIGRFARVSRRGCATRSPVAAEIFVLSEESVTPSSVPPGGIVD
jgi:hypothetical protein